MPDFFVLTMHQNLIDGVDYTDNDEYKEGQEWNVSILIRLCEHNLTFQTQTDIRLNLRSNFFLPPNKKVRTLSFS
jgi:hypothetical protein